MKALDAMTFPLSGASLIEASAGTGKTYTIVNLFLRLLLGHGCRPHELSEILVVTFTNAATAELRHRIRMRLQDAQRALLQGQSEDAFLTRLLDEIADRQQAQLRLSLAIREMDAASVFTIHSFSQRMLAEFAFESGVAYEQTLIMDESQLRQQAVEDYWRRQIVSLPPALLSMLQNVWPDPSAMQRDIAPFLARDVAIGQAQGIESVKASFAQYQQQVEALRQWWLNENMEQLLLDAALKRNVKAGKPATFAAMTAWCRSTETQSPFPKEGWRLLGAQNIQKALSKNSADFDLSQFDCFDDLSRAQQALQQQLVSVFSANALSHVRHNLRAHKQRLQLLAPDDLLAHLRGALSSNAKQDLVTAIAKRFPAALIDEFQDTDPAQFDIFHTLYAEASEQQHGCWVMIGDPKQAIYAFRGADIHTYIKAKRWVPAEQHYTLATNWRSRADLVEAVNACFSRSAEGFLYDQDIPFQAVAAARRNVEVTLNNAPWPVLSFDWLKEPEDVPVPWAQAQQTMAQHCAEQIAQSLQHDGKLGERALKPADYCVLVRDRNEAELIKRALFERAIQSVFLARHSVFATEVCQDLYLVLSALSHPGDDAGLRAALATSLFANDAATLESMYNDEMAWQLLVEQWYGWQRIWQRQGVMAACYALANHFSLFERQMQHYGDGMRRITDLRHLIELLQQQSRAFQSEAQLIQWLTECMSNPDHNSDVQQMRLESDQDLVQIVTMHASKGLEYPLVFIPFGARHRAASQAIYHDESGQLQVDFNQLDDNLQQADFERLAEDIRLLYVAMTRAVYHCRIGLWNAAHTTRKKQSVFVLSALGRMLLGPSEAVDNRSIERALQSLAQHPGIAYEEVDKDVPVTSLTKTPSAESDGKTLQVASLAQPVARDWFVTSYSAISRQGHAEHTSLPGRDEGEVRAVATDNSEVLNVFTFDKGAQAGSFLHGVLENIEFARPDNLTTVIENQAAWFSIDERWHATVEAWVLDVLACPVSWPKSSQPTPLNRFAKQQVVVEMEFHLPLEQVSETAFNQLLQKHAAKWYRPYQFGKLNGMLKGFIDLTLQLEGRFYVADYKSNHLGDDLARYQPGQLHDAMVSHDYYLQALLYVVALHRFLQSRLPDYEFDRHIGGATYLFLRGMQAQQGETGIIHYCPSKELVLAMDALFNGQQPPSGVSPQPEQGQLPL